MKYRVSGKIELNGTRRFSKRVEAGNENIAKEKIFVFFGNVYRLTRRKITIERVEKL